MNTSDTVQKAKLSMKCLDRADYARHRLIDMYMVHGSMEDSVKHRKDLRICPRRRRSGQWGKGTSCWRWSGAGMAQHLPEEQSLPVIEKVKVM